MFNLLVSPSCRDSSYSFLFSALSSSICVSFDGAIDFNLLGAYEPAFGASPLTLS